MHNTCPLRKNSHSGFSGGEGSGEPAGFAKITAPIMSQAVRGANRKDLKRLKSILEQPSSPANR